MIVSFIEGRIRLRDERLRISQLADAVKEILLNIKGIKEVSANQRAGSILILYDKAVLKLEQILQVLADYLNIRVNYEKAKQATCNPASIRRIAKIGMLLSLAISISAALLDLKALHVAFGVIFLGFLGLHLYLYKNIIFA